MTFNMGEIKRIECIVSVEIIRKQPSAYNIVTNKSSNHKNIFKKSYSYLRFKHFWKRILCRYNFSSIRSKWSKETERNLRRNGLEKNICSIFNPFGIFCTFIHHLIFSAFFLIMREENKSTEYMFKRRWTFASAVKLKSINFLQLRWCGQNHKSVGKKHLKKAEKYDENSQQWLLCTFNIPNDIWRKTIYNHFLFFNRISRMKRKTVQSVFFTMSFAYIFVKIYSVWIWLQ